LKIIGKFKSGEYVGKEFKIYFHAENTADVHSCLFPYLNCGLFFNFGDKFELKGRIESESTSGNKMTLFLMVYIEPEKMSDVFSLIDQTISLEITEDQDSVITKRGNNARLLAKIKHTINTMARSLGYTYGELQETTQHSYAGRLGIARFNMIGAEKEDLEGYIDHLYDVAQQMDIDIGQRDSVENYVPTADDFLKARRLSKKCCICSDNLVFVSGIYPLCKKHHEELVELKKQYPKVWEKKFKAIHKLE